MSLPIETPRLMLRRYRMTDIPDIVEYSSHPMIARVVNWNSPEHGVTEETVRSFLEAQRDVVPGGAEWLDLAVALKPSDTVIGSVGIICRAHQQGQIGWALGVAHQGKGLATEAARAMLEFGFGILQMHRIYAVTTTWNRRSWLLMERIGMRREAHYRESERAEGEWRDGLVYAILKREWQAEP